MNSESIANIPREAFPGLQKFIQRQNTIVQDKLMMVCTFKAFTEYITPFVQGTKYEGPQWMVKLVHKLQDWVAECGKLCCEVEHGRELEYQSATGQHLLRRIKGVKQTITSAVLLPKLL